MSIALGAMAETFIHNAQAAGIPMEVLHRVAAMASGGMDTLPHNGAVITLLAVTAAVVALLLIITYRSPTLWLVPLLVIAFADRVAAVLGTAIALVSGE